MWRMIAIISRIVIDNPQCDLLLCATLMKHDYRSMQRFDAYPCRENRGRLGVRAGGDSER